MCMYVCTYVIIYSFIYLSLSLYKCIYVCACVCVCAASMLWFRFRKQVKRFGLEWSLSLSTIFAWPPTLSHVEDVCELVGGRVVPTLLERGGGVSIAQVASQVEPVPQAQSWHVASGSGGETLGKTPRSHKVTCVLWLPNIFSVILADKWRLKWLLVSAIGGHGRVHMSESKAGAFAATIVGQSTGAELSHCMSSPASKLWMLQSWLPLWMHWRRGAAWPGTMKPLGGAPSMGPNPETVKPPTGRLSRSPQTEGNTRQPSQGSSQ